MTWMGSPVITSKWEISGTRPDIVLIGVRDSILAGPAQMTTAAGSRPCSRWRAGSRKIDIVHVAFRVAFVNEEPPLFQTSRMGSFVYANRCKARGDKIASMISLETIGCFSDAPNSQRYPAPGLECFLSDDRELHRLLLAILTHAVAAARSIASFRGQGKLPSQGASLPSFIPGVANDQWSFLKHGYPRHQWLLTRRLFVIRITTCRRTRRTNFDYDRFALVVSGVEGIITDTSATLTINRMVLCSRQ